MMNLQILIPSFLVVVMTAVVITASGYPYLQAKLAVLFSGTLVLVLALVQLVRELHRTRHKQAGEPEAGRKEARHDVAVVSYVLEASWMIGFALTIYLFGFLIAIPVFICAYMKSHGTGWLASILTGGGMAAFCYVVFVLVLEMRLHAGILFMQQGFR